MHFIPRGTMALISEASQTSCRLPLNSTQLADSLKMKLGSHVSRPNLHVCSIPPNYLKMSILHQCVIQTKVCKQK